MFTSPLLLVLIYLIDNSLATNYDCPSFYAYSNDTVNSLYESVAAQCTNIQSVYDISILVNGVIILNPVNDTRTLDDIEVDAESIDIQIIPKPDFAALLEMVSDIRNKQNIPWFHQAMHCLSDPSTSKYRTLSYFARLTCNDNGEVIEVDLSHLNLTGTIHLQSLPQNVRSLDLSFNDLDSPNLNGLRGKSLQRLNVEHNERCSLNMTIFDHETFRSLSLRVLQMSSNQMSRSLTNWMCHQRILNLVIVDGVEISRGISKVLYEAMLKVVGGITNKWMIPWYGDFFMGFTIDRTGYAALGITVQYANYHSSGKCARGNQYRFNMSGLGLKGHIDLGSLSRNVMSLDLSNNKLSSIWFHGDAKYDLRFLDIRGNPKLKIDLAEIDASSSTCSVFRAYSFAASSNQLKHGDHLSPETVEKCVEQWLRTSTLFSVVLDQRILSLKLLHRLTNLKMRKRFCEFKVQNLTSAPFFSLVRDGRAPFSFQTVVTTP